MVDHFKIGGYLKNYELDQYCRNCNDRYLKSGGTSIFYEIPNRDKSHNLILSYRQSHPNNVWIFGNLRKWWLPSGHAICDLNSNQIIEALIFLSERIGAEVIDLFSLRFLEIEIGANILLPKNGEIILPSALEYPQLKRVQYGKDTVYFKGSKYHLKLYDKLKEMADRGMISKGVYKIMRDRIFILRFEICINSPSGYRLRPYIVNFETLVNHYDDIVEEWVNSFFRIEFSDLLSKVKNTDDIDWTKRKFVRYMAFFGLETVGIETAMNLSDQFLSNRRSETRKDLMKIVSEFRSNENGSIFNLIAKKVVEKSLQLRDI